MKWEDLRDAAQRILDNAPTGEYRDETFSIRSGELRIMDGLPVVHRGTSDHYDTVANGSTSAKHVTIRCRDTGASDRDGCRIYEAENGMLFVFWHHRGDAYSFSSGALKSPVMQPVEVSY